MNGHRRLLTRAWVLPMGVVALIGGHLILYVLWSHLALSAAVASGVIALIVLKHLGLLSAVLVPLAARFRRGSQR